MASGSSGGKAGTGHAPFRWQRWLAALLLTGGALGIYAFWLFTGAHPVCQVTVAGSAVTKTCGLPDVTDFCYVLAVVAVLLLPDAKSIKIGGLEFVRLTNAVREQAAELDRLSQQVSQVVHTTSNISVTIAAARLASVVADGEAAGPDRTAADLTDEFGDAGSS
jgi:hypothetical protein